MPDPKLDSQGISQIPAILYFIRREYIYDGELYRWNLSLAGGSEIQKPLERIRPEGAGYGIIFFCIRCI